MGLNFDSLASKITNEITASTAPFLQRLDAIIERLDKLIEAQENPPITVNITVSSDLTDSQIQDAIQKSLKNARAANGVK